MKPKRRHKIAVYLTKFPFKPRTVSQGSLFMFHNAGVLVPYCYCIFCALLFLLYQLRFCYSSWRAYRRLLLAPNPPPPATFIGPLYLPRRISLGSHIHVVFITRNAPPEVLYYFELWQVVTGKVSSLKLLNSIVSDYRNCKTEIKNLVWNQKNKK